MAKSILSPSAKTVLLRTAKLVLVFYLLLCTVLYFLQERLIFFPEKLDKNFGFIFSGPFNERFIKGTDGTPLHALLFKADSTKGLIFYLHGNAGSLNTWGVVANRYTALGYDVLMLDYRGYGKSEGRIRSEQQLFDDAQIAYNEAKKEYKEDNTVIIGYSIGTGIAAKLASENHPRRIILQAPYYSLTDMMKRRYPFIPTFLLKYGLQTVTYLKQCAAPVALFHGDADEVIPYTSSVWLKAECTAVDTLITLRGQGHDGMTDNRQYIEAIQKVLR